MRGKQSLEKHTYICVSDREADIDGYRAAFSELINEQIDQEQYKSIISDQGYIPSLGLIFISYTFIPK